MVRMLAEPKVDQALRLELSIDEQWAGRLTRYCSSLARNLQATLPEPPCELIVELEHRLLAEAERVFTVRGLDLVIVESTVTPTTARLHATIDSGIRLRRACSGGT